MRRGREVGSYIEKNNTYAYKRRHRERERERHTVARENTICQDDGIEDRYMAVTC